MTPDLTQASAFVEQGDTTAALRVLDALVWQDPGAARWPGVRALSAEIFLRRGQPKLAIDELISLTATFPDDAHLHALLGEAQLRLGQSSQAAATLQRAIALGASVERLLIEAQRDSDPLAAAQRLRHAPALRDRLDAVELLRGEHRYAQAIDTLRALPRELTVVKQAWAQVLFDAGYGSAAAVHLEENAPSRLSVRLALRRGRFAQAAWQAWGWWRRGGGVEAMTALYLCALHENRTRLATRVKGLLHAGFSASERRSAMMSMTLDAATTPAANASAVLAQTLQTLTAHARAYPGRADARFHLATLQEAVGDTASATQELDQALAINPRYAAARAARQRLAA